MEVVRSHKKASSNDVVVSTLPLYRSAPPLEVRLDDFELFAIDRLRGTLFSSAPISKALIRQEKKTEDFGVSFLNFFDSLIWDRRNATKEEE